MPSAVQLVERCGSLQAGFRELYGEKYHIDVVDLATHHSPYPFNQASKSYNTMVCHLLPGDTFRGKGMFTLCMAPILQCVSWVSLITLSMSEMHLPGIRARTQDRV